TLLGNRDLVARVKIFFLNPDAIHLDAVGAALVADVPVTAAEAQLGVQPGDVRKRQFDVAGLPASERQFIAEETNRITAADRHQLTMRLQTHCSLLAEKGQQISVHIRKRLPISSCYGLAKLRSL